MPENGGIPNDCLEQTTCHRGVGPVCRSRGVPDPAHDRWSPQCYPPAYDPIYLRELQPAGHLGVYLDVRSGPHPRRKRVAVAAAVSLCPPPHAPGLHPVPPATTEGRGMTGTLETLEPLRRHLLPIAHLNSAASVLSWDQETYMPPGGGEARAEHLATLQGLAHERLTSRETEDLLGRWLDLKTGKPLSGAADGEDPVARALLRETWRDYTKAKQVPNDFVRRLGKTCSLAQQAWAEAKKRDDFASFLPHLTVIVALKKEEVGYRGPAPTPYDALLDTYEPGATTALLLPLFAALKSRLVPLLDRIVHSPVKPREDILARGYDRDQQLVFGRMVLETMGYDFERGRLDISSHPFTTSFHPSDVGVTTRVSEQDFTGSLFSCIHEGGHGLYDQALPAIHYGTPLGEAVSLGLHESQSRLWENCVGLSRPFWQHFYPLLQHTFPDHLRAVALDDFHASLNIVKPSFIRVDADEQIGRAHV